MKKTPTNDHSRCSANVQNQNKILGDDRRKAVSEHKKVSLFRLLKTVDARLLSS